MRGRTLRVPDIEGLRPTPSRTREALFNILGDIQDYTILDLFAGSGMMALEALSRGASSALSIDMDRQACKAMKAIQRDWHLDAWRVRQGSLPHALPAATHFNIIYADPPYGKGLAEQVPLWLARQDITFDTLVIEEATRAHLKWKQAYQPSASRKYGETILYFFQAGIEGDI